MAEISVAANQPRIELVVAADEPALFFYSVAAAARYLEVIDVMDGVYPAAYGREGEPFEVSAYRDKVCIEPLPGEPSRPDELATLLIHFLASIGETDLAVCELRDLLARCERHVIEA